MTNHVQIYSRTFDNNFPLTGGDPIKDWWQIVNRVERGEISVYHGGDNRKIVDVHNRGMQGYEFTDDTGEAYMVKDYTQENIFYQWVNGYIAEINDEWETVYKNEDKGRAVARSINLSQKYPNDLFRTFYWYSYSPESEVTRKARYYQNGWDVTERVQKQEIIPRKLKLEPLFTIHTVRLDQIPADLTVDIPVLREGIEFSNARLAGQQAKENAGSNRVCFVMDEVGIHEVWYDHKRIDYPTYVGLAAAERAARKERDRFIIPNEVAAKLIPNMKHLGAYTLSKPTVDALVATLANIANDLDLFAETISPDDPRRKRLAEDIKATAFELDKRLRIIGRYTPDE